MLPRGPDGGLMAIAANQDFTLVWTGGQAGASLTMQAFADPEGVLECTWPSQPGQGTIPRAALAPLSRGSGVMYGYHHMDTMFDAGDWSIDLRATTAAFASASYE
jgi:hypothetical protein